MSKKQMELLTPNEMTLHFIHRKTKQIVELSVEKKETVVQVLMHELNNNLTKKEALTNQDVCENLPAITGNVLFDTLAMVKHFKKHGFKVVNTITQTKNGIKLS